MRHVQSMRRLMSPSRAEQHSLVGELPLMAVAKRYFRHGVKLPIEPVHALAIWPVTGIAGAVKMAANIEIAMLKHLILSMPSF